MNGTWMDVKNVPKMLLAVFGIALGITLILALIGVFAWLLGYVGVTLPFIG